MSFGTGFNFTANTLARASQVNQNFLWFRGSFLPITQSNTWDTENAVSDLGAESFHWLNAYVENLPSCVTIFTENLTATNITAVDLTSTTIDVTDSLTAAKIEVTATLTADNITVTDSITADNITVDNITVSNTLTATNITSTTIKVTDSLTSTRITATGSMTANKLVVTNSITANNANLTSLSVTTLSIIDMAASHWPNFSARKDGTQVVPGVDFTTGSVKVTFATEVHDSGGFSTSTFHPAKTGTYMIMGSLSIVNHLLPPDPFTIGVYIFKNSSTLTSRYFRYLGSATVVFDVSDIVQIANSTDTLEIHVQHSIDTNTSITIGTHTSFMASRIA